MWTKYTVFWCFFHTFCFYEARHGAFKSISSGSVFLVHWIHRRDEYRLSVVQIVTSSCQSWIDGVQIDCTSCVMNVLEEIVRKWDIVQKWKINETASWMTLKSSEIKNLWSWWYNSEIFSCFLRLLRLYFSTLHQANVEIIQYRSEYIPLFSGIQSLHHLLEVDDHDEEEYSDVLTLVHRLAKNLLAQHQSTFFPRLVKFLWMGWQKYVFLVLLWPLMGSQKQIHSSSTQILVVASHEKFWPMSENCLLIYSILISTHIYLVSNWLWLPVWANFILPSNPALQIR